MDRHLLGSQAGPKCTPIKNLGEEDEGNVSRPILGEVFHELNVHLGKMYILLHCGILPLRAHQIATYDKGHRSRAASSSRDTHVNAA